MHSENDILPWFALQVRIRHEQATAAFLQYKGYEWFLPLHKCKRRWSDRTKEFKLPLFPGYLFCRFDPLLRLPILKTPGVLSILGIGKTPVPVDEAEIAALQSIVQSGLLTEPWPFLQIGQRVQIEYGPLAGLEGIIINSKSHQRFIVSVTLLQRSVAVEMDGAGLSAKANVSSTGPSPGRGFSSDVVPVRHTQARGSYAQEENSR